MIDPNDPFIVTQSEMLLARTESDAMQCVLSSGETNDLPLKTSMLVSFRLARFATLQCAQKNMDAMQIDELKDENAELRKRLLPDAMPKPEKIGMFTHCVLFFAAYGIGNLVWNFLRFLFNG